MKTVIHVWKNTTKGKCIDLFEYVKCTCYLVYLSKQFHFKLYVDTQLHSISNYTIPVKHPYQPMILENNQDIPFIHDIEQYILSSDSDLVYFSSTTYMFFTLNKECKDLLQLILQPCYSLQCKIDSIPVNTIVHVHINHSIITSMVPYQHLYYTIYDKIKPYLSPNTIVLSDTKEFKTYLKSKQDCIVFDTKIGNIGYTPHDDCIEDTLIDLYLMTKAKKIYSFSWYKTIPGFVKLMYIYDVPLVQITY